MNSKPKITVAATWCGGDYYSPEYVNRLYRAVEKNLRIPYDFILYVGPLATEERLKTIDPRIITYQTGLPYWWGGMKFLMKDPPLVETKRILYLDLDQVIVGSLDELVTFPAAIAGMKDYPSAACPAGRERDICTSTVLFTRGSLSWIWEIYESAGRPSWDPIKGGKDCMSMSWQGILNDHKERHSAVPFPENWICSYKLHRVADRGLPPDCRIVAFHGRPKQHEVMNEPRNAWIRDNWHD